MSEKRVSFGRIFWPSLLAVLIVALIGFIVFFLFIGGLMASLEPEANKQASGNTVLHLTLNGQISESSSSQLDPLSLKMDEKTGLSALLLGFNEAAKDERIKGVFLEIKDLSCGLATAREIRNAINRFEKSGKFVVAYLSGEIVSKKEYYISSAANECYGFPSSILEFSGLGSEMMFFKNTLDQLGVEMQVIRGKNNDFKSAVEPFLLTGMSDSSKHQSQRYMNELWRLIREDIASDRKISARKLNDIADQMLIKRCDDAPQYGLIDGVKYRDEVMEGLAKKVRSSVKELNLISFEQYADEAYLRSQEYKTDANVAVVLAEGDINTDGDGLSSTRFCKYLREIRQNPAIKAVVIRINSPGGSALASDEMWREISLLHADKKVVVSMGDVAASGGYYIAAPAAYIFAEPTTITGSIGVFGVIPYTGKMMEDKLGISFDRVGTNRHSGSMSTNRKLSPEEMQMLQDEVEETYQEFLQRVAEGRHKTKAEIHHIARGRVWVGTDALQIGLVDALGGLQDAIDYASDLAKIKKPSVQYYPKAKRNPLKEFIKSLDQQDKEAIQVKQRKLPAMLDDSYQQLIKLEQYRGIQMRMPFRINFE